MASLVILLIFSFIQCLSGEDEGKEDKMLAENIPVPSSPVPIATIDLVQSQAAGSPALTRPGAAPLPIKKTKHQEEQEDVNRPAWVLSGAPWVTIAFAIVQIREMMSMAASGGPPAENQPLQISNALPSTEYEAVPNPTRPAATDPAEGRDQTHPGGAQENLAFTAESSG